MRLLYFIFAFALLGFSSSCTSKGKNGFQKLISADCRELISISAAVGKNLNEPVTVICHGNVDTTKLRVLFNNNVHTDTAFLDEFTSLCVAQFEGKGVQSRGYVFEFAEFNEVEAYQVDTLWRTDIIQKVERQKGLSHDYRELRAYIFRTFGAFEIGSLSAVLLNLNKLDPGVEFDASKNFWQTLELATNGGEDEWLYQLAILMTFRVAEDAHFIEVDEARQELFKKSFGSKNK